MTKGKGTNPKVAYANRMNPDAMEVKLTKEQALQLIRLGLDTGEGPIVVKDGFEAQRIRLTGAGVRFDLVPTSPSPRNAWPEARGKGGDADG